MDFEQWWAETWKSPLQNGTALEAAFKEIAKKAWEAGYGLGNDEGYELACFDTQVPFPPVD